MNQGTQACCFRHSSHILHRSSSVSACHHATPLRQRCFFEPSNPQIPRFHVRLSIWVGAVRPCGSSACVGKAHECRESVKFRKNHNQKEIELCDSWDC